MSALLHKANWYRRRLASMSGDEVFHRLSEAVKKRLDQFSVAPSTKDFGGFRPLADFRDRLEDTDITQTDLISWQKHFEQIEAGHLHLLNKDWPTHDPDKRWHLDPVTMQSWPRDQYAFDIDYRHNREMGDVKYVWEINRLQFLQPIAVLAYHNNDLTAAQFCLQQIENWIENNPPYRGINWSSGIELALRLFSIFFVLTFVGKNLTSPQRAKIWGTVQAHGRWLERYPSKYSSANNHRTAEGLGLFLIGAACPSLEESPQWLEHGWSILCESAETQILPDGVSSEQAVSYGAITLEMLQIAAQIAQSIGVAVPYSYRQTITKGYDFIANITDNEGNHPLIGDDDNGFVLDPILHKIFLEQPSTEPMQGVRLYPDGGYCVARHVVKDHNLLVVFDHGNLGFLSIAAHGHADALSIWLHIDGQPIFVDAGTYLYHAGGIEDRDAFRETSAHNTLCLENTNSSTISGPFNWSHKAQAKIIDSKIDDNAWHIEAEHDGYVRNFDTIHRRKLAYAQDQGLTITDKILGPQERHVQIGYLLHPDLNIRSEGNAFVISKGTQDLMTLLPSGNLKAEIQRDANYAPRFGAKQKTLRLVFEGLMQPDSPFNLQCSVTP